MIFFFILNLKSTEEIGDCCFPQKAYFNPGVRGLYAGSLKLKELVKINAKQMKCLILKVPDKGFSERGGLLNINKPQQYTRIYLTSSKIVV